MHGVQRNTQTHAKSSKGAMTHFQGASQQLNAALHIFQRRAFRMVLFRYRVSVSNSASGQVPSFST